MFENTKVTKYSKTIPTNLLKGFSIRNQKTENQKSKRKSENQNWKKIK